MTSRWLLLLLLCSPPAWAEDPEDVAPAAPEMAPVPLGERLVWERRPRVGTGARLADLDVQPVPGGSWIAVDVRGAVWLSEDEGARWVEALGTLDDDLDSMLPDDEAVLLEAESLRDDALDDLAVDDLDPGADPAATADEAAAVQAATEAAIERAAEDALEEAGIVAAALSEQETTQSDVLPVGWFDPVDPDLAFVARADGVWRSSDAGRTWVLASAGYADDPQVTCFARAADGALVAGTVDGVRFSVDDAGHWIDVDDATDGARVNALIQEDGALWAATDAGLFRSTNGLAWTDVGLPGSEPVRAIVPDPSWEQGFWVATSTSLLRTDDGGATFYAAGRQPLRGLRQMVHIGEVGHLLATSDDGVWESMDGGVAWSTADAHLNDPDVRALAFTEAGPVIATRTGIWRMVLPRESFAPVVSETLLTLPETIRASVTRAGLDMDMLSLSKLGVLARFAPTLTVDFKWGTSARRDSSLVHLTTTDAYDDDWSVGAAVCWGACSSVLSVTSYGEVDYSADDSSFYVFDGEVYDEGEPVAAAANVAQHIRSYRRYLAEHVSDAWLARARAVAETRTVRTLPIREQVMHEIQLQELDARLDALTQGAFTRSISRQNRPSEESP